MKQRKQLPGLIQFIQTAGKLKQVKRQGWLDRGVRNAESVADHSFMLALMAMLFAAQQKFDVDKAVQMALVHDLPEALCGDTAARIKEEQQQESNKKKHRREQKALEEILRSLDSKTAKGIFSLWHEFEQRKSKEAKLVYELDRLEAIFQAIEYERKGNFSASLQEFFDYADARLRNPLLRKIFLQLMKESGKRK